ncbi:hypothetical protein LTS14_008103 [Recurvomyces mirabilis]|nr:hypothetical protein LTS14_008103 [Recurvomyces mirabilis]
MQGIDVEIHADSTASVLYERAMLFRSPQNASQSCVRTIELKSNQFSALDERRHGMKGFLRGAKKLTFGLDVNISGIPSTICLNQPFSLRISMRQNNEKTTATVTPPTVLESATVQFLATTRVNEPRFGSERAYSTSDTQIARTLSTRIMKGDKVGLASTEEVYGATVAVWPLLDVPTSFTWGEVSRAYRLKIELEIVVADKMECVLWESGVEVLPPTATGLEVSQTQKSIIEEHLPAYEATCS